MDDTITYVFQIDSGDEVRFDVVLDRPAATGNLPDWTLLEKDQCPHCPLPAAPGARCPAAADLVPLVQRFAALASIGTAEVRVVRSEYEVRKRTDTQTALSAMMGLVLATSGCPVLSRLRPLAYTHLPFANETETIYRIVAMQLLGCYLNKEAADLKGLEALFTDIDNLNLAFAKRIKRAIENDASINALVLLHSRNMMASLLIDENLEKIRAWFQSGKAP